MAATNKIPLHITASPGTLLSRPFQLLSKSLYLNIQFFYTLTGEPVTVTLMQSLDGSAFDSITDLQGEELVIGLDPSDSSATLNLVAFYTPWIRLQFAFPQGSSGSINHIIISR